MYDHLRIDCVTVPSIHCVTPYCGLIPTPLHISFAHITYIHARVDDRDMTILVRWRILLRDILHAPLPFLHTGTVP